MLILTLAVSFIITWGVGLTPPLVIRYAIFCRPLSKRMASWIAAGSSAFFWMTFLFLNVALGQKPGTGAVWVIMFFVARWIMSRGYIPDSTGVTLTAQREGGQEVSVADADRPDH